jgi:glycosyltransferase involved in cell wall biosynthesis
MLNHAGIGTYIRNVVPRVMRMRAEWAFTLFSSAKAPVPREWLQGLDARTLDVASDIYSLGEQIELPVKQGPAELYWSPHYAVPAFARGALVATVHDVGHLALGDMYGGVARATYARTMFEIVRRRAARILVVSDFTRSEFAKHVGVTNAPITVTHDGVDPVWLGVDRTSTQRPRARQYLLFVGSVKPHKNLRGAIGAFAKLADRYPGDLVVVGDRDVQRTLDHDALKRAESLGDRVTFTARVDDATLRAYVAHADVLVFPSLYEGFGLPPLEAMAAGTPAVVSNRGALVEVCGDAALYCDPADEGDIARQVSLLLEDAELRRRQIERGRARAAEFTWEKTATLTARALTETLDAGGAR